MCFILKISKYFGLWPFSVFSRCQCVYTHQAGRAPALHQNWQSSEKSQHFKEKTIFNEHPVDSVACNRLHPISLIGIFFLSSPIHGPFNVYNSIKSMYGVHFVRQHKGGRGNSTQIDVLCSALSSHFFSLIWYFNHAAGNVAFSNLIFSEEFWKIG